MHFKRLGCKFFYILLQGIFGGMKHLDVVTLIVTFDLNLKIRIHVNCSDLRYLAQFGFSLTGKIHALYTRHRRIRYQTINRNF